MKRLSNQSKRSSGSLTWWDTLTNDNKIMSISIAFCTAVSEFYFLFMHLQQREGTLIEALLDGVCVGALFGIIIYPIYKVIEKVLENIFKK